MIRSIEDTPPATSGSAAPARVSEWSGLAALAAREAKILALHAQALMLTEGAERRLLLGRSERMAERSRIA